MRFPRLWQVCLTAAPLVIACNDAARGKDPAPAFTAEGVRPAIAWPEARAVEPRALSLLLRQVAKTEEEVRSLLARSVVPVLAPRDLTLESPTLTVEGEYFALTGKSAGTTIALHGTRTAKRYKNIEPVLGDRRLRGNLPGFVSANEGIRTASWIERGAAYSVDVECSNMRDPRCQDDAFLLGIVEQLAYVGGAGR